MNWYRYFILFSLQSINVFLVSVLTKLNVIPTLARDIYIVISTFFAVLAILEEREK